MNMNLGKRHLKFKLTNIMTNATWGYSPQTIETPNIYKKGCIKSAQQREVDYYVLKIMSYILKSLNETYNNRIYA